mgnify:CR=1 FL=1
MAAALEQPLTRFRLNPTDETRMTALSTFGAVLTFAIDLEARLHDYYRAAGRADRAQEADKRRVKLERVRRESVLEITLEAIEGLDAGDYALNLNDTTAAGQQANERTAARFYAAAAPKINVREAQRVLERCGREHEDGAAG